jgi:arsenite methyltransferase
MVKSLPLNPEMIPYLDELPLWSAPFGLRLLESVQYRKGITALDIGFGTGFPLTEMALRLGSAAVVYGIDPWKDALQRAAQKLKAYGISNVNLIEGVAESIPLPDASIDLITSNNGINNVSDIARVFAECARICKPWGQFVLTMNTDLSMVEFYSTLETVLGEMGMTAEIEAVHRHIAHKRPSVAGVLSLLHDNGFTLRKLIHDQFDYTFADGTAMLNHYFIRLAFLESWIGLVPPEKAEKIFEEVERRLNETAERLGHLKLSIPFVVIDAMK